MRPLEPGAQRSRRDLRRMRAIATGLLVAVSLVFVAARLAPARWSFAPWVAAFAEAAMVGALADWFAVSALFRRPLGLPIPHTAIIPRNKDRIGRALGEFIAGSFLSPRLLDQRVRRFDTAARLGRWLSDPAQARRLAEQVAGLLPEIVASSAEIRDFTAALARRAILATPAAPLAGRALDFFLAGDGAEALIERLLAVLARETAARGPLIRAKVREKSWRWLPSFVDDLLAARITGGLVSTLEEMADPDHPWRGEIRRRLADLAHRLRTDETLLRKGETLKARVLDDPAFRAEVARAWDDLIATLARGEPSAPVVGPAVERAILAAGRWLEEDAAARQRLQGFIRVAVRRLISERRQGIGDFVAQVVAGWDEREVARRIELQVGADLQYIRINGAVVGGLAGLAIYALSRLL